MRARTLSRVTIRCGLLAPLLAVLHAPAAWAQDPGSGAVPAGRAGAVVKPAEPEPDAAVEAGRTQRQPAIERPKLVRFEHAPYPEAAKQAGLEGSVILRLTIDAAGNVTAAEVAQGAGHGFDEAAQAAALQFKWEPARVDGQPRAVNIEYEYRFTLDAPPPEAAPPPPPQVGNLGGRLAIAGTDVPLVGAQVVVTDSAGQERRLLTDDEGKWSLEGLPPGPFTVRYTAAGYQAAESTEEVSAGEETLVTYRLAPDLEGIVITIEGERPPREVTRRTIVRREIERVPGTGGDALRAIQSLPGVARPPGLAGLLIIRGSAPEDSLTFVDGTDVPLIYHFGGLSSTVPTELLDRIDFYPGNFSSRYGRVMGGIVDVGLRSPNTRCNAPYGKPSDRSGCFHGMAQVDLIDARLLLEGPIGKSDSWSFVFAGRRSWFDAWLKPVLEAADAGVTTAPVYWDYQGIVEYRPSKRTRLSFRGFGSDDALKLLIKDPFTQDPGFGGNIRFGLASHIGQVLYTTQLDDGVELYTMLSYGKQVMDFGVGPLVFDLTWWPLVYRSEIGWKLSKGAKLNVGLDFQTLLFDAEVRSPPPPQEGEPDGGPFSTRAPLEDKVDDWTFRPGWYVEGELTPTERLRLVPGLRLDYARDSGHADFSPRFNARYDVISPTLDARPGGTERRRTTIKGGVGLYQQPPQFDEINEVFGTPYLESNRAIHYSVGIEQELTKQIEVSIEGYYKDLYNLVASAPDERGALGYTNDGLGHVVGMEALLKYKPDKRFFGWLAYTLSRSIRQNNEDDQEYLQAFDQTHNLILLGSYRLGRGWEAGASFQLSSGSLYTPVASPPSLPAIYSAEAGAYYPLQGEYLSRRLPLAHQLDIRIDKMWQFAAWRFRTYLDVQNAYNNPVREALLYNYNYSNSSYQQGVPILPSIGLRGEF